jgi:hypothetical protein
MMPGGYMSGCLGSVRPYQGPGDIVAGAIAWWGLRAYSFANIGATILRLRRSSDNAEQNFTTIANGGLDYDLIKAFAGGSNLFVVTLLDQVGTYHLSQATAGNQPALVFQGLFPVMAFDNLSSHFLAGASAFTATPQPFTVSAYTKCDGTGGQQGLFSEASAILNGFHTSADDQVFMYAGAAAPSAVALDTFWIALQTVWNNTASDLNINGTQNTVSVGSSTGITGTIHCGSYSSGVQPLRGRVTEMGLWPAVFTTTDSTRMSANQRGWGPP